MAGTHDDFVRMMVEKSKKKFEEAKPQKRFETQDYNEVENITNNIRDRLQKKKF